LGAEADNSVANPMVGVWDNAVIRGNELSQIWKMAYKLMCVQHGP